MSRSAVRLKSTTWTALAAATAVGLLTAGCGGSTYAEGAGTATTSIDVSSTADACELSATEAPSGTITFTVTNNGSDVTEFYLLGSDGEDVVGEVEDIGPGLSRDLKATLKAGSYQTRCKPGMAGDGITAEFTVTP